MTPSRNRSAVTVCGRLDGGGAAGDHGVLEQPAAEQYTSTRVVDQRDGDGRAVGDHGRAQIARQRLGDHRASCPRRGSACCRVGRAPRRRPPRAACCPRRRPPGRRSPRWPATRAARRRRPAGRARLPRARAGHGGRCPRTGRSSAARSLATSSPSRAAGRAAGRGAGRQACTFSLVFAESCTIRGTRDSTDADPHRRPVPLRHRATTPC